MPFPDYLARGRAPSRSGSAASLEGDAAGGIVGTLGDMLAFGAGGARADAARAGDARGGDERPVPRPRRRPARLRPPDPNDWGLGFELRDGKSPHWTGSRNSPRTFGHFGSKPGTATFLWIDPERRLVAAAVADRLVRPVGAAAWPTLSDALLEELEQ